MASLGDLPDAVLVAILQRVDVLTLVRSVGRTNRRLRALATSEVRQASRINGRSSMWGLHSAGAGCRRRRASQQSCIHCLFLTALHECGLKSHAVPPATSWAGQVSLGCCGWRAALAVGGACNGGAHAALAAWSGAAAPAGASPALQRPGAPCGGRASVCRCSHGALSLRSNLPQADMERMIAYTCAACLAPRSCRGPAGGQLERLPPAGVGTPGPP